ncbi:MAG: helix-turn-helix transcriptional regulator [Alphaproteobacteria bacterium]|nr:helix-turn-helix transcriptional regulator [Alphaproteobacteria bacterium]MBP7759454.1 helix-turn-helix transcriptional regulator [Alphaproteobacteria bacterium]MBP7904354.1 helix-turn-helix transcriptional regulator [Alphaproteobacteria bacterium]
MDQLRFTIPEMLSLIGVFQCVYILVYVLFRAGNISRVVLPLLYFLVLGVGFFLDFGASYIGEITPYYDLIRWCAWFLGPPLSVLVIIQVAQTTQMPSLADYAVLLFVPAAMLFSLFMASQAKDCQVFLECSVLWDWLDVTGLVAGAASLLMVWLHRDIFSELQKQKAGKERYWVILSIIFMNIFLLAALSLNIAGEGLARETTVVRTLIGLSFIYLVTTSLFRIYPQALLVVAAKKKEESLTSEDQMLADKIAKLLELEKIYHEATYSRSDLAQELGVSEATVTRIIGQFFNKSFPQLLNERRIDDAKRLLLETEVNIKTVAEEVGFNSLPSFNRVFKELAGISPSEYRKNMIK